MGSNSTHRIASNIYEMYDNSISVVSGNYLRLACRFLFRYNVDDRFARKLALNQFISI